MVQTLLNFFPMMANVVGRILLFSYTFAIWNVVGFIPMVFIFAIQYLISYCFDVIRNGISRSQAFFGVVTSITAPCLVVKEDSRHFLRNGLVSNGLCLLLCWAIYLLRSFGLPYRETIFDCNTSIASINETKRCLENFTSVMGMFTIL